MNVPQVEVLVEKLKGLAHDIERLQEPGFLKGLKPNTIVTDWYVAPYVGSHLRGLVSRHPILDDGPFESSELWYINEDLKVARTLSRWFRLGTPLVGARPKQ